MESVGRLAGGVAHEANNQMSVVLGAAEFILQRSDVPEAVRDDAQFIRRAAERTAAVTAQLLAFSRRQILKPQVLNLNEMLTGWETVLRRVMGEDYGVTLRLAPEVGLVRADPGQLEQVVLNLALNARDAMQSGGSIRVETFNMELAGVHARLEPTVVPPGSYVVLAVSDTGQGMAPETMSHIFEPFFTTKEVGQGTGLGLATVYGIVKQSGGYIWVYSEPGQGTTFKVCLPRVQETAPEPAVVAEPVRSGAAETILVVEDEANVRSVMKRALEGAGYHVLESSPLIRPFPRAQASRNLPEPCAGRRSEAQVGTASTMKSLRMGDGPGSANGPSTRPMCYPRRPSSSRFLLPQWGRG